VNAALPAECLLLSPHLDDAAFSLGATLLDGRIAAGTVVNVYTASCCTADDGDDDVARVSARRGAEDAAFFAALPARLHTVCLGLLDAPLRRGIAETAVCTVPSSGRDQDEIVSLAAALRPLRQGAGLLLAPLGVGGHVDHRVAHGAACLMAGEGWPVAFYEDLPYAGGVALPEIEAGAAAAGARIGRRLEPVLLPAGPAGSRKAEAVSTYASQVDASTLERIRLHGARLGGGTLAERVWRAV
jgi:LmbE family N-acetylglucosaminyl deacetylase